ncbi:hypothetical protein [Mycoplasma sp. E35C]|uniref:hypothetical protein n=1 Tax=Mycoplasma sp. E35C TaxID=2801918 RepID=UPI001CA43484|nr:hypothetical protein [Mycoplasma sp. E35C]QZX48813.1 hypothetical protein JJE79_02005 [Mycoplasma sp. E35C]
MLKMNTPDIDSKIEALQKEIQEQRANSKFYQLLDIDFWRFILSAIFCVSFLILSLLVFVGVVINKTWTIDKSGDIGLFWNNIVTDDNVVGRGSKLLKGLSLTPYGVTCIALFLINTVIGIAYYIIGFKDKNYTNLSTSSAKKAFNIKNFGFAFAMIITSLIMILGVFISNINDFPKEMNDIRENASFGYAFNIKGAVDQNPNEYQLGISAFGYILIVLFFLFNALTIFLLLYVSFDFKELRKTINSKFKKA